MISGDFLQFLIHWCILLYIIHLFYMQKKILIPLVLIFAVSGVALGINFSNPNYLPDTVDFPRIPMGSGTIGEVIGKILGTNDLGNYTLNGGNGDVQNTQMLS